MNAILIDPFARDIRAVELANPDSAAELRGLIECDLIDVRLVDAGRHALVIDDEGILGDLDSQAFFYLHGTDFPIPGRALLIGNGKHGETLPPTIKPEEMGDWVQWLTNEQGRVMFAAALCAEQEELEKHKADGFEVIYAGPSPEDVLPDGFRLVKVVMDEASIKNMRWPK